MGNEKEDTSLSHKGINTSDKTSNLTFYLIITNLFFENCISFVTKFEKSIHTHTHTRARAYAHTHTHTYADPCPTSAPHTFLSVKSPLTYPSKSENDY